MRDVALVPERHVLERRDDGRAHHAGKAGEVLGEDGIALVRHGGRALLALREELLGLHHLGALQMADLGRQALDRRRDDGERGEEGRMPVARDHLGRNRFDFQAEFLRDVRLDPRVDIGERADRAGERRGRDLLPRRDQPPARARKLGIGRSELEAEGGRLGVDPVRAADGRRELVLTGAALERGEQRIDVSDQDVARPPELHGEAGVEHVRAGHPLMHEAGVGADEFGEVGEEGDHVVLGRPFDLVDPRDVEFRLRALFPRSLSPPFLGWSRSRPSLLRRKPRSRTRCESASRATRRRSSRGGSSGGSSAAPVFDCSDPSAVYRNGTRESSGPVSHRMGVNLRRSFVPCPRRALTSLCLAPDSSASRRRSRFRRAAGQVALIDRHGKAAGETSFGNAGIIETVAVIPYVFPRAPVGIARGALNLDPRAYIRYGALPSIAPAIWRYYAASTPAGKNATARAMAPLLAAANAEHLEFARAAGAEALLRRGGWIKAFRSARGREMAMKEAEELKPYGIRPALLDRSALAALEPHLGEAAIGAAHYADTLSTSDPEALAQSYAALFVKRGGRMETGDARSARISRAAAWTVDDRLGTARRPRRRDRARAVVR